MAEEIPLEGSKFVKTDKGWVDKKTKEPASADYQKLLDVISNKTEKSATSVAEPVTKAAGGSKIKTGIDPAQQNAKKLVEQISKLTASIEKLTKNLEKTQKEESPGKDLPPDKKAKKIPELKEVPTLRSAAKQTLSEGFFGKKDKSGVVEKPGAVREFAEQVFPVSRLYFSAKDKQRNAIAANTMRQEMIDKNKATSTASVVSAPDKATSTASVVSAPDKATSTASVVSAPEMVPAQSKVTRTAFVKGKFADKDQNTPQAASAPSSVTIIGATDDFFSKLANAIADSISNAMKSKDSENKAGAEEDKLKLKPKEGNTKLAGATKIGGGFQAASGDVMQGGLLGGIAALLNPKAIMDMLKGLGKKLLKVISDVVENIVKIFTSVFDSVKSVVQNIAKRIGSIFEGIMGAIEGLISKLPGPIKKLLGVGEKGVVKGAEGTATKAIATKGVETAAAKTAVKAGPPPE